MGHSSLLGTDRAAAERPGRDVASLGPGDSSDSGSDMMGIADGDEADPGLPADVALRDDHPHPLMPSRDLAGSTGDASGTGERSSAASDAGPREAADIGVDRIFTPGKGPDAIADDEDADLAFMDDVEAGDPLDDEDLLDEDDVDGDIGELEREAVAATRGDAEAIAPAQTPVPGQPNPAPDVPVMPPDDDSGERGPDDDEERPQHRVAALLRRR